MKVHRENLYSYNLGVNSKKKANTLVSWRGRLDLFVPSLLIKLSKVLSPGHRPSLGRTTLNCVFFFLYLLIFILYTRGNRSHSVLEVVGGDLVSLNYWYHSKYGISGYAHNNWHRSISIHSQQVDALMVNAIRAC